MFSLVIHLLGKGETFAYEPRDGRTVDRDVISLEPFGVGWGRNVGAREVPKYAHMSSCSRWR